MSEVKSLKVKPLTQGGHVVLAIAVLGLFFLLRLQLGLTRYYNAEQLERLVSGADAKGEDYSVVIHNRLTGSYSFNAN